MRIKDRTTTNASAWHDELLTTVNSEKTGTVKTVNLRTYKSAFGSEALSRRVISKTKFGENSKLRALGVDSIEFAKKSKDMTINMLDGKKIDACLRKPGEIDFVKNFFNLLKRLK